MRERYDLGPVSATERLEPVAARSLRGGARSTWSEGSPLMLVERVAYAADGTAVEFAHDRHRGDAARFVIRVVPDEPCSRRVISARARPARAAPALEPVAGTRRGRARAARRRDHEPQLPAAAGRARRRRAAARARTPSCSGSTATPSARRPRRRPRVGRRAGGRRVPGRRRPASSPRSSRAAPLDGRGAARAGAPRARSPRRCARSTRGAPLPSRFDAFAIVAAYQATARAGGVAMPAGLRRARPRARTRSARRWPVPSTRPCRATTTC